MINNTEKSADSIAIVGISLRLPGADSVEEYWNNLTDDVECIGQMPENRKKDVKELLKYSFIGRKDIEFSFPPGGYLDQIDGFDYKFFHLTPKEAKLMDPAQRLFLESVWEAVEDAGYTKDMLSNTRTSVYVGYNDSMAMNYYNFIAEGDHEQLVTGLVGNLSSIIPGRVSNFFNLKGPSMFVNTACSSSLVAVNLACESIWNGGCEMAIAGGVQLNVLPHWQLVKVGIESNDGRTRTYDNGASGTIWSEGVATIVLKPLQKAVEDGDFIYASIKGGAMNQDGASAGITVPSGQAQKEVLMEAWKNSGVNPETINYIESHGTGTKIGDPIEIEAISKAFAEFTPRKQFCAIGSVKTNIGHTNAASGIAGLIKAALSLYHKKIPATLNFTYPNNLISFEESPVYVNDRLQFWHKDSDARRCGVSAFGFSGTNCHMVLEEVPVKKKRIQAAIKKHILAISAESQTSLLNLLCKYKNYLSGRGELGNICFSANTGRNHFSIRIAFLAGSIQELKDQIDYVIAHNLSELDNQPDIYYGGHKIIPYDKKEKEENDVYENEIAEFTREADTVTSLSILDLEEDSQKQAVSQIAQLYVKGANINWNQFFEGCDYQKVRVPTYAFDRKRCWLTFSSEDTKRTSGDYDLIDTCLSQAEDLDVYGTLFTPERHWVLTDHIINGKYTIPGTTYIDMISHVAQKYIEFKPVGMNLQFITPITMGEGEKRETKLKIHKTDKKEFVFEVVNCDKGTWIENAKGNFWEESYKEEVIALDDIKQRCSTRVVIEDKDYVKTDVIQFGDRWKNLVEVFTDGNEYLGYFELQDKFKDDLIQNIMHPALLDVAVNFSNDDRLHLPMEYQNLVLYDKMPSKFYSYVTDKSGDDIHSSTVKLADLDGHVFAEVKKYLVKTVKNIERIGKVAVNPKEHGYQVHWVEQPALVEQSDVNGKEILLMIHENEVSKQMESGLKQLGANLTKVTLEKGQFRYEQGQYYINGSEEQYRMLFDAIKDSGIQQIIHAYSIGHRVDSMEEFKESLDQSLYNLFRLSKGFLASEFKDTVELVLLTEDTYSVNNREAFHYSEGAALFGLGKVILKEIKNLKCRGIDIDSTVEIDEILTEINSGKESYLIALRENKRFVEEFGVAPKTEMSKEIKFTDDGVYVITGGLGGIGLEMAKHIIQKGAKNLALISRSGMPEQEKWDDLLEQKEDPKMAARIKAIREMEAMGGNVTVCKGNVADIESMSSLLEQLRSRYTTIKGILHCAGIAGDKMLLNKTEEGFTKAIQPKVEGTWILDKLTRQDNLEFMVLFSSISSLIGTPGQSDYTAANAYMDAFAQNRSERGFKTVSINWPAWYESGMAVDYNVNMSQGVIEAVSNQEALEIFDYILNSGTSRQVAGKLNMSLFEHFIDNQYEMKTSIQKTAHTLEKEKKQHVSASSISISGRVRENYSDVEVKLANIWGQVLELDSINIFDNFYLIGGDSIQAIKLTNAINEEFGDVVDVSDIFYNLTIEKLAGFIQKTLEQDGEEEPEEKDELGIDDLLEQLESGSLSIEDVEKLL